MGPESGDVVVRDFDGNVLSSFWQYGLMDWDLFYTCLDAIIFANDSWAIFHYDEHAPGRNGAHDASQIVKDTLPLERTYSSRQMAVRSLSV